MYGHFISNKIPTKKRLRKKCYKDELRRNATVQKFALRFTVSVHHSVFIITPMHSKVTLRKKSKANENVLKLWNGHLWNRIIFLLKWNWVMQKFWKVQISSLAINFENFIALDLYSLNISGVAFLYCWNKIFFCFWEENMFRFHTEPHPCPVV